MRRESTSAVSFSEELLKGGFCPLPNFFLCTYVKLGLTETEVMVLLHLLRFQQVEKEYFPPLEKLAALTTLDLPMLKEVIAHLIEKGFLAVEPYFCPEEKTWKDRYTFQGLFQKLEELWWEEKKEALAAKGEMPRKLSSKERLSLLRIYKAFEKEFGRPLSPMESLEIAEWYEKDGYSAELILAALKQAVLRGVLNLKYIQSILRDWAKHNIRTPAEAASYEEDFRNRKKTSVKQEKAKKEKYKDVYLN